jgi:outer membrane receptor protein involved in Fe transport
MPSKFSNCLQLSSRFHFFKFFRATFSILISCVLIGGVPLHAGTTGKISGRVTDAESGEGLPGANIVVEGTTLGAATDVNGNYVILNVPPSVYTVAFSFVGYQSVRVKEVRVSVDFTTTLNAKMKVTAVEVGAVEVIGERQPLVREDLTNTTVAVNAETIESLPVDAVQDVVRLQSGVTVDNAGVIHIRGGRANEIAFQINGISIANPFNNAQAVGIATNAIEELTVSSGAFSAEYGDALSGVINFVTKDGGSKYAGNLKFWTGDNVTAHDDIFDHIDDIDPLNTARTEATFSGPVPFSGNKLTFFTSGVYVDNKGYLYGRRLYLPSDGLTALEGGALRFDPLGDGKPSGDGAIVPLNASRSTNFTLKLSYKPVTKVKLTYDLLFDRFNFTPSDRRHEFKFNPDGLAKTKELNQNHSLGLTHTIGNRFFYTLKAAYSETSSKTLPYDDPFAPIELSDVIPPTDFSAGGIDLNYDRLSSHTFNFKLDAVSQIRHNHEVKLGSEVKVHRLERESYALLYTLNMALKDPPLPPIVPYRYLNPDYDDYSFYLNRPVQFSAYILDKMELARTFIVNAGLRLEYLDTRAFYNPDLIANVENPDRNLSKAKPKTRLSPRVSLSYPITERGIIRFSYGHFYQLPTLQRLYSNAYFESYNYTRTPTYADPNLKPERSIQYEMGLQQQFGEDFKIDLTVYYKDVNDLLQTRRVLAGATDRRFNILTNVSYANVRGFSIALLKRRGAGSPFSASLDYTFQIAEGSFSDPLDNFFDAKSGKETEQTFVYLDHDRTHTLNGTFTLGKPNSWNLSALASFWLGTPYTPNLPDQFAVVAFQENSARRPTFFNVDLRVEKFFKFAGLGLSVFTQIENVFDIKNERLIFTDSGRSLYSIYQTLEAGQLETLRQLIRANPELYPPESELDNYYRRADFLSEPREVRVGFSLSF